MSKAGKEPHLLIKGNMGRNHWGGRGGRPTGIGCAVHEARQRARKLSKLRLNLLWSRCFATLWDGLAMVQLQRLCLVVLCFLRAAISIKVYLRYRLDTVGSRKEFPGRKGRAAISMNV